MDDAPKRVSAEEKRTYLREHGWVRHDLGNTELWMSGGTWVGLQPIPISLNAAYKRVRKMETPNG